MQSAPQPALRSSMRASATRSGENHSNEVISSSDAIEAEDVACRPALASVAWKSGGTALRSSMVPIVWSAAESKKPANRNGTPLRRTSSPSASAVSAFVATWGSQSGGSPADASGASDAAKPGQAASRREWRRNSAGS